MRQCDFFLFLLAQFAAPGRLICEICCAKTTGIVHSKAKQVTLSRLLLCTRRFTDSIVFNALKSWNKQDIFVVKCQISKTLVELKRCPYVDPFTHWVQNKFTAVTTACWIFFFGHADGKLKTTVSSLIYADMVLDEHPMQSFSPRCPLPALQRRFLWRSNPAKQLVRFPQRNEMKKKSTSSESTALVVVDQRRIAPVNLSTLLARLSADSALQKLIL